MKKRILLAAMIGSCMMAGTAFAGQWRLDQVGYWYQNDDGSYPHSAWMRDTDGKWYYFNEAGYMHTGWLVLGDKMYYLDASGKMLTGQQTVDGSVYRFDAVNGDLIETIQTDQWGAQGLEVNTEDLSGYFSRIGGGADLNIVKTKYGYLVEGRTAAGDTVDNYMEMIDDSTAYVCDGDVDLIISWVTSDYLSVEHGSAPGSRYADFQGDYFYEKPAVVPKGLQP
ncbi:MAG: hypothetical protein HFG59_00785 [Lachnospiraceae bacterium]|nr:hypothetical protein [Lachnospiraceae bacterium]